MKKHLLKTSLFIFCVSLFSVGTSAQDFKDLDVSPMDAAAYPSSHNEPNKLVKVIYSRPQLRGRTVESLTTFEKVWRTGANEATEITFYKDAFFGGKAVKKGTYSLFSIPSEKEWVFIINKDIDVWGAYSYNEEKDVLRCTVPVSTSEDYLEPFSISFADDGSMHVGWGNLRVIVPVKEQSKPEQVED